MAETWIPWAVRDPAPADKRYSAKNQLLGIVLHSMEGTLAGARSRLMSQHRLPDGSYTSYSAASWHFSLAKGGTLYQHYPLEVSCWHAGNRLANTRFLGLELEGTKNEPINLAQMETLARLLTDLRPILKIEWQRDPIAYRTMWLHREVATIAHPNAGPTACPSARYEPFFGFWNHLAELAAKKEGAVEQELDRVLERLNEVLVRRFAIIALASQPDAAKVDKAYQLLKGAGLL